MANRGPRRDLPSDLREAKAIERIFGVPPEVAFNRHLSAMIEKAKTNPREAIKRSYKAQSAVSLAMIARGKNYRRLNGMFRAARSKIVDGMYSGLLYTIKRIAEHLEDEGMGISVRVGGTAENE